MKKFLLKVLLFFALVVVMDFAWDGVFSWLRSHAKGGSTENCEYIANRCEDDIIILGSSRATHHYVPQIIEDSLGLSCYNCGEEGNGIVLAYGRFKMLTNRYKPKLIIYEITPRFDYGTSDPNSKYLGYLRPYYNNSGIKTIFNDFDGSLSFLKMQSKMYQNTGKLLPDLVDNFIYRDNRKGYEPLFGLIDVNNHMRSQEMRQIVIDSLKLSYVERLLVEAQNNAIPIVCTISPEFGTESDMSDYYPEIDLCLKHNIPCINSINYLSIAGNPDLFQDLSHLNNKGAEAYTRYIVSLLKNDENIHLNNR